MEICWSVVFVSVASVNPQDASGTVVFEPEAPREDW